MSFTASNLALGDIVDEKKSQKERVGAIMPTPTMPTPTIPTQFLPANNADSNNPDFNIDTNNVEK